MASITGYTKLGMNRLLAGGFIPNGLPRWRMALSRVLAGTGDAKLLCIGDSTTGGYGGNGGTSTDWQYAYPTVLASSIQASGLVPAARGLAGPNTNPDSKWTVGSGWTFTGGSYGWGKNSSYVSNTSALGNLVYADPGVLADRFDIYYLGFNGANGPLLITATGGSATTVPDADTSSGSVQKTTVSAGSAATTNSVSINRASGSAQLYIVGVEPWLSTSSRVRVGNVGAGGTTTGAWADTVWYGALTAVKAYAPDLSIISLGINDANSGSPTSTSTYLSNLQTVIGAAQSSGDVVVMPPMLSRAAAQSGIIATERGYAASVSANLPWAYADIQNRQGDGDVTAAAGMMYDNLHRNATGYSDVASMLANPLLGYL